MRSLHTAGHHITAVHSFPEGGNIENYTVIDASREDKPSTVSRISISTVIKLYINTLPLYDAMLNYAEKDCNNVFKLKEIQVTHAHTYTQTHTNLDVIVVTSLPRPDPDFLTHFTGKGGPSIFKWSGSTYHVKCGLECMQFYFHSCIK